MTMENKHISDSKDAMKEDARKRAYYYESTYHGCGQCTMLALQEVLGLKDELAFKAASCLDGATPLKGKKCGSLMAGIMVLGMKYGRARVEEGLSSLLNGMLAVDKLVKWFEREFGSTVCPEITGATQGIDEKALRYLMANPEMMEQDKELLERCSQLVSKTAARVVEIVNEES